MMTIKFSLIMAAYNAEKYITEAILSVLNQTYEKWELIIVDDGSSDKTYEIIKDFSEKDFRIHAIHQNNSGTAAAARNTALKYVTGDYVQMLDSDDFIQENLLAEFEKKLQGENFDIIVPNCICFQNDTLDSIFWEKEAPSNDYNQILTGEKAFELSIDWTIHGFFLVRNEIIQRVKYDPMLINGDEFTTRKLFFNATRIGFVDTYYYYRRNLESTTKSDKNRYRMYECLITDTNIYKYSLENNMRKEVVNKCKNNLIKSFFSYCKKFIIDKKTNNDVTGEQYAYEILKSIYSGLDTDMFMHIPLKYKLFYILSNGSCDRLINMINLSVIFRRKV